MIWLSWRQHRVELMMIVLLAIALAGLITTITGQLDAGTANLHRLCNLAPGPPCASASTNLASHFSLFNTALFGALLVAPALIGVFVGAPLIAREFEAGTARFVWTQSVTRLRWLGTKLAILMVSAALTTGVVAVVSARLVDSQLAMFTSRWASFDIQGSVLVAYVLFGLALGATLGALIRRVVPAMAATALVFVMVRVLVLLFIRPNFAAPAESDISQSAAAGDNWVLGQRAVDLSGKAVSDHYYNQLVANAGALQGSMGDYLRAHGVVALQIYQPESRFWLFQNLESALFLLLSASLIGFAAWWIRRT